MERRAGMIDSLPYKTTPVFDENTLPGGLRKDHRTKAGVWGIIRVLPDCRSLLRNDSRPAMSWPRDAAAAAFS
jgi:tellurite resistance-related uncharacterized protein